MTAFMNDISQETVTNIIEEVVLEDWLRKNYKTKDISFFMVHKNNTINQPKHFYVKYYSTELISEPIPASITGVCENGIFSTEMAQEIIKNNKIPEYAYLKVVCFALSKFLKLGYIEIERDHLTIHLNESAADNCSFDSLKSFFEKIYGFTDVRIEQDFRTQKYIIVIHADWKNTCAYLKLNGFIK